MESKLPKHIRKELLAAADQLEMLAEYTLTNKTPAGFLKQFLILCNKVTSIYSIEAGTYVMKYVFCCEQFRDGIAKTLEKLVVAPEWKLFASKCGDFVLHANPPGFGELVEIYEKRMENRKKS
jgi:hypothetical protein